MGDPATPLRIVGLYVYAERDCPLCGGPIHFMTRAEFDPTTGKFGEVFTQPDRMYGDCKPCKDKEIAEHNAKAREQRKAQRAQKKMQDQIYKNSPEYRKEMLLIEQRREPTVKPKAVLDGDAIRFTLAKADANAGEVKG